MKKVNRSVVMCLLAVAVWFLAGCGSSAAAGFLADGEVWAFLGDSITHADTYRRVLERVMRHHHPEAEIRFIPGGKPGALATASSEQFRKAAQKDRPTVVSLMTGMNNSINSGWRSGQPMDRALENYRRQLMDFTRAAQANGVAVILMSPTLTDESLGWGSMWALDETEEFLRRCGAIVKEVARNEGAFYVPVAETVEAMQQGLLPEQILRHDGVHPSASGQYAIASALLSRLDFSALRRDEEERELSAVPEGLPLQVRPASRFLRPGQRDLELVIVAPHAMSVEASWSNSRDRAQAELDLEEGTNRWRVGHSGPLELDVGKSEQLLVEIIGENRRNLYLIDLFVTRVLDLDGATVSGTIVGSSDRPEGPKAVEWSLAIRNGSDLWIEAEVFDSEIRTDHEWPWGQDGLQVWLDYRPAERFADIGLDSDVYQFMLQPRPDPEFSIKLRPWLGRGIHGAAAAGGSETAAGYRCHVLIGDGKGQMRRFSKWQDSDLSERDYLGFSLIHTDLDSGPDGRRDVLQFNPLFVPSNAHDRYGNTFWILDLKDTFDTERIINVHLSRLLP